MARWHTIEEVEQARRAFVAELRRVSRIDRVLDWMLRWWVGPRG